jgi:hypothetical protein
MFSIAPPLALAALFPALPAAPHPVRYARREDWCRVSSAEDRHGTRE